MIELDTLDELLEEYFNNDEEIHCENKMYTKQMAQINKCENEKDRWIDEFACEHYNDEVEK